MSRVSRLDREKSTHLGACSGRAAKIQLSGSGQNIDVSLSASVFKIARLLGGKDPHA
jgi:hypothetical protein